MWHTICFIVAVDQKNFSIARLFHIKLRTMNSGTSATSVANSTQPPLSRAEPYLGLTVHFLISS